MSAVVIGIGNPHRRDDGVGPAVAARVAAHGLVGVEVHTCPTEPAALLDAWDCATLAVLVDAAAGSVPGRVQRCAPTDLAETAAVSSHDLNVARILKLGLCYTNDGDYSGKGLKEILPEAWFVPKHHVTINDYLIGSFFDFLE